MVPATFPTSLNAFTNQRQLVALFLGSVAGLQRWVDYVPVNFGNGTTLIEGSYDNNGFIAIQEITSGVGLQAFLDYIPVFFDPAATDTWQVSAVGYIPYGVSGVASPPSLDISFTRSQTLDPRITFSRASTGTHFNASGVLEVDAINTPRFDYNPVTLAPLGLLIEEQRTNLALYSQEFSNAYWTPTGSTISPNTTTAPDGTTTADTLVESTLNEEHRVLTPNITWAANTAYTQTWFVKPAGRTLVRLLFNTGANWVLNGRTAFYDLTGAGSVSGVEAGASAAISLVSNGFYRISLTATTVAAPTPSALQLATAIPVNNASYTGDGTSGVFIWGAQLEAGAFPTSYIPTTTAAATRAADVATMIGANFSNWYNQSEGTLFAEGSVLAPVAVNGVLADVNDGTTTNRMPLYRQADAQPVGQLVTNNINQAQVGAGATWTTTAPRKLALAYAVNDFAFTANGGAAGTVNLVTLAVMTRFSIGSLANTQWLNGHIRRIAYYPRRLANTELVSLTS